MHIFSCSLTFSIFAWRLCLTCLAINYSFSFLSCMHMHVLFCFAYFIWGMFLCFLSFFSFSLPFYSSGWKKKKRTEKQKRNTSRSLSFPSLPPAAFQYSSYSLPAPPHALLPAACTSFWTLAFTCSLPDDFTAARAALSAARA